MKNIGESSGGGKEGISEEDNHEDVCFFCKDGGTLVMCDHKRCLKAYHFKCVSKDDSCVKSEKRWTCDAHSCFICHKSPEFNCICCPKALCRRCIVRAEFVQIKGKNGLCSVCLTLALHVEENGNFESEEHYVSYFGDYWKIINAKECLTLKNLRAADVRMKKGNCFKSSSDTDEHDGHVNTNAKMQSGFRNIDEMEEGRPKYLRERCSGKEPMVKRKKVSDRKEVIGWGSRALIDFLKSIDIDVSQALPQKVVTAHVMDYVKEKKLFCPDNKGTIICDQNLQSVFGRKTVKVGEIFDYLDSHFNEKQNSSGKDDIRSDSKDKQGKSDRYEIFPKEKKKMECSIPQLQYVSINPKNIRLVYLKRSLVEKLAEEPRLLFDRKVIGSFVKFKSDPKDSILKNTYKLVEVTGTAMTSGGENGFEILVQVSGMEKDISVSLLSDGNITEDECKELKLCIQGGLLKQPTVAELERKARTLHEDITKHWIARELELLQIRMDHANEKGWRKEFYEHSAKRKLLQTSSEQAKLLNNIPLVVAAEGELELLSKEAKNVKQGDQVVMAPKTQNSSSGCFEYGLVNDDGIGHGQNQNAAAKVIKGD